MRGILVVLLQLDQFDVLAVHIAIFVILARTGPSAPARHMDFVVGIRILEAVHCPLTGFQFNDIILIGVKFLLGH